MKAVLTCDDVFDVLTRAPFPSGGPEDEIVESHLAVCHECRQLAEAFRPAIGLFHEAMSTGLDEQLPSYRGRLAPIIESHVSLFAPRKSVCSRSEQRHSWTPHVLAIVTSVLLISSVVFATLAANQRASRIAPVDSTLLAAFEIPTACRTTADTTSQVAIAGFVCCTKCHNADSRVASTEKAILKSSVACIACHDRLRESSDL